MFETLTARVANFIVCVESSHSAGVERHDAAAVELIPAPRHGGSIRHTDAVTSGACGVAREGMDLSFGDWHPVEAPYANRSCAIFHRSSVPRCALVTLPFRCCIRYRD